MTMLQQKEQLYLQAKAAYYAGQPIMSDSKFDALEEELKTLGSKVINIVGTAAPKRNLLKHLTPILSLSKVQVLDEANIPMADIIHWYDTCKQLAFGNDSDVEMTPKLDGNAVSLQYENGELQLGLTRYDDMHGYDITNKVKHFVPNKIADKRKLEVRGEVVINLDIFAKKYSNDYKNARNFIAGKLNPENDVPANVLAEFTFVAFELKNIPAVNNSMQYLFDLGFNQTYQPLIILAKRPKEIIKGYFKMKEYRAFHSPFQLDGIVLKYGEQYRSMIGATSHHPKWALAIKFPPKEATTTIVNIEWTISKTGELRPIAVLKPVELDGATITKASLHNYGYIVENKTLPGAVVTIARKGDIVPQIIRIEKESVASKTVLTETIEKGGYSLSKVSYDGVHAMYADNDLIAIRKFQKAIAALDIKEIGDKTVERLYKVNGIDSIVDLFDASLFNETNLIKSGEFQKGRELDIILNAINSIKELKLERIIESLQFDNVGTTLSKKYAEYLAGVNVDWSGMNKDATSKLLDSKSQEHTTINVFVGLLKNKGINVIYPQVKTTKGILFEMTGSPDVFKTKAEFVTFAEQKGFEHGKLTKETKYLITDSLSSTSSKMDKAKKLGVTIITYSDFVQKYN